MGHERAKVQWRENALCSGQQKPTQREREPYVETNTVWTLRSSPEGICNHVSSLTVIFVVVVGCFKFFILLIAESCLFVYSSQRPRVALYFQSVKPRPLHFAYVPIPWIGCYVSRTLSLCARPRVCLFVCVCVYVCVCVSFYGKSTALFGIRRMYIFVRYLPTFKKVILFVS